MTRSKKTEKIYPKIKQRERERKKRIFLFTFIDTCRNPKIALEGGFIWNTYGSQIHLTLHSSLYSNCSNFGFSPQVINHLPSLSIFIVLLHLDCYVWLHLSIFFMWAWIKSCTVSLGLMTLWIRITRLRNWLINRVFGVK